MSHVNARFFEAKVTVLSEMIKHDVKEEEKRSEGLTRQFADGHLPPAHTRSYTGHNLVQDKPLSTPTG